ncbi:hypothetical protein SBOR_2866 [Sclerotinia borealis F-4128]|uniref:Uncharacterized protein n=1 Tax=Sclerotinia borealis (strain F-4128) TaxID=1432307 RepID=W9CIY1_SCLBF|nr:hypothetical protein SBOR_2866 [Sclerotinia borealis F-4128]
MADIGLASRLRYLNESAHLLATSAPSTSKYMMSQCNFLILDHEIEQTDFQKQKACGACGAIRILGREGKLEFNKSQSSNKKRNRKKESGASSEGRAVIYTCGSCNKKTRHPLNAAPAVSRPKKGAVQHGAVSKNLPAQALTAMNTIATPSTNAGSKKRAKNRKLGGLGALLAKQKASEASSSGFGLDLMDLMKKA